MPSSYTSNLGIEKPASGEQSGTWGDTVNTNSDILDRAIGGQGSLTLASAGTTGSPNTFSISDGATDDAGYAYIAVGDGGDLGGTAYLQLTPNDAQRIITIRNDLSASRSLVVFQGGYASGSTLTISNGSSRIVAFDGTGSGASTIDTLDDLEVDTITFGDASATRTALGLGGAATLDLSDILPTGIILMWSGAISAIPSGWALCDGTNGTPNLTGRFVIHADADSGGTYNVDDTGGSATITDVPAHTHTASSSSSGAHTHGSGSLAAESNGAHTHDVDFTQFVNTSTGGSANRVTTLNDPPAGTDTNQTSTDGAHTHSISGSTSSAGSHTHTITVNSTGDASVSVLNPYYALAYIMKT